MRRRVLLMQQIVFFTLFSLHIVTALSIFPAKTWARDIRIGYEQRVAADPSFPMKSVAEVFLAAATQLTAEVERRGIQRLGPELDFVIAGVLTAIVGKYYSMWKVAKTKQGINPSFAATEPKIFGLAVPTNAFQRKMLDGITVPSVKQRLASFIYPMAPLFRAGFVASLLGYGMTALFVYLRSLLNPAYEGVTRNVNVLYASVYTGVFVAVVSNVRYQLLQGLLEPCVDHVSRRTPPLRATLVFLLRVGNGVLGSILAISGMRLCGLQRLKQ